MRIRARRESELNPRRRGTPEERAYARGFLAAASMVDDLYAKVSLHPYLLGDCILFKANLLNVRRRIRQNPHVTAEPATTFSARRKG